MQYTLISPLTGFHPSFSSETIAHFLHKHLDEFGDAVEDIQSALDYAVNQESEGKGFVLVGHEGEEILGVVVINETNMSGYIPENILVYIATHRQHRGKGLGKKLMNHAIKLCKGDIALHVEKDNPARFLYEKIGFTNPYLEMRLKR